MHEGMDRAISDAMHRYATRREEVRERFITILGHDLRDPLATVMISAKMLASNPGLEKEHRMVAARIGRACNRMQRMINDVLDFARGHLGGGIPANPTNNDMGEIVKAAADEAVGANPQRTITCTVEGDLRGAFDRDRVHQAITNLIGNAVNHTHDAIEIRAFESADGHAVFTEVTSHGEPIPEPIRRRLFDRKLRRRGPPQGPRSRPRSLHRATDRAGARWHVRGPLRRPREHVQHSVAACAGCGAPQSCERLISSSDDVWSDTVGTTDR
jgi:signal transduction histidine kinase